MLLNHFYILTVFNIVYVIEAEGGIPMWVSDQGEEGQGVEEAGCDRCFSFFFFLVSAGGKETLSFDIIPCCQITSATGMGDCHLMMPYKCHCKKKRF